VLYGLAKVVKIRLKHFSVVLTGTHKNCTPTSVGMSWFSSLGNFGSFGRTKIDKVLIEIFLGCTDGER